MTHGPATFLPSVWLRMFGVPTLRWYPSEHAQTHSTAGWQRLHWWKGRCTPRTSRAPTQHLLPRRPLRKWMPLNVVVSGNGRSKRDSRLAHPVLLDGALCQRSIADVVATGRNPPPPSPLPPSGCADGGLTHDHNHNFHFTQSLSCTVDQCYLTELGQPPPTPHFEKELQLNTKSIEKCLKTWRFKLAWELMWINGKTVILKLSPLIMAGYGCLDEMVARHKPFEQKSFTFEPLRFFPSPTPT